MPVSVTFDLPAEVEAKLRREYPDLAAEVKGAYGLELFRRGELSHYELAQVLGLDHLETDAWLKRHGVLRGSPTMADLEADWQTLQDIIGQARG